MGIQQSFVRGAAILGLAALLSKILGAVYRIPYQNITGNEGMYVYQQVYPLYSTLLIVATAGFPIAISKLVSEKLVQGNEDEAKRVFRLASLALFLTGCFFFVFLFFGAGKIAEWMGNRELLTQPIQAVSFALLIVPFLSAMRGYFQGHQNMVPTAVSQVLEQLVRVMTILIAAWYAMEMGMGVVAAGTGAMFGATTGGLVAFAILLVYWRKNQMDSGMRAGKKRTKEESAKRLMFRIWAISIPVCVGSLVLPLYSLVDSFTVGNVLVEAGWSMPEAIEGKGIYDRGQPLIQFASFFASAISLSIVPAIAEAVARRNMREVEERAHLALKMTWLFGLPATVGLMLIAEPANVMLFKDSAGSDVIAILAWTAIFSTLGMTTAGILQGVGRVALPALHLLIGAGVKWLLNLWWIPLWDLRGAAWATVAAFASATLLNIWALSREVPAAFRHFGFWRSLWAVLWMAGSVLGIVFALEPIVHALMEERSASTVVALAAVFIGAFVYLWAMFRFGVLKAEDLEKVPKLKKKLGPLLHKLRLIRA